MTIQTVPTFLLPNNLPFTGTSVTGLSATAAIHATLDAANEAVSFVFVCPAASSLTDFTFRTQSVSVTAGPLNWDVRVETVVNGRASGTLWAANTNVAVSIANTDDNVWKTATFTSAATVAQGDKVAIVIKSPGSGTFNVAVAGFSGWQSISGLFPISISDVSGAPDGVYDTINVSNAPAIAIKISGTWYRIEPWAPADSHAITSYDSGTASNEYAMRFTCPVSVRVKGAALYMSNMVAGCDLTISLWPDSGSAQTDANALAQVVLDGDIMGSTTVDSPVTVTFPSSVTLTAGAVYWLGARADTTNNIAVCITSVTSVAMMDAMPGGSGCYQGARAWSAGSANAFTTTTTSVPLYALVVDGIDLSSGGGGIRMAGHGGLAA